MGASGIASAHALVVQRTRTRSKALRMRGGVDATDQAGNSRVGDEDLVRNIERATVAVTRHGCARGEGFVG